jgi:hypothetical protein
MIVRPEFESQQGEKFSFPHGDQTDSWAYPTSYPIGTGNFFFWSKSAET